MAFATRLKSSSVVSRGAPILMDAKPPSYFSRAFTRSPYSQPFIRWVGCTSSSSTPFFLARSRACFTLSMLSPSRR
jgi:hypothetical protein